jgi:hypothetical protein
MNTVVLLKKIKRKKWIYFNWQFNDDEYVFKDHLMISTVWNMQWDIENKTVYKHFNIDYTINS